MKKFALQRSYRAAFFFGILLPFAPTVWVQAQTLARPGWVGSGMTAQSWFRHAVLYDIDTRSFSRSASDPEGAGGNLKGISERLDYIKNLGVDAILLEPLAPKSAAAPVDPALGTVDDFDMLSLEASKRGLRILLSLSHPDIGLARFWLTRGVAGFYIPGNLNDPALASTVQAIRKMLPGFVGQRILLTDADLSRTGADARSPANELQRDPALLKLPEEAQANRAAGLRSALEQSQTFLRLGGSPSLVTDALDVPSSAARFAAPGHEADAAKLAATVLLLNRSVPIIYAGQELGLALPAGSAAMISWGKTPVAELEPPADAAAPVPVPPPPPPPTFAPSERYVPYVAPVKPVAAAKPAPPDPASVGGQEAHGDSVFNFYRQLIQLHHGKASLREGEEILIHHDDANTLVLVRKPANPSLATPALVAICNLSASPLQLSIKQELTNLRLRGSFLRSVLNSETEKVSMNLDPVTLPPFGVYIGELRY
jgi:glycosidase